jgi:hypothetical protein
LDRRAAGDQNKQRNACQKIYRLHSYLLSTYSFIAYDLPFP